MVGLGDFVGGLTSLAQPEAQRTHKRCAVSVLPACVSLLGKLHHLMLAGFPRLMCAPGWAELPKLETLHLANCGAEGDGEHAFPGTGALLSLSRLNFWNLSGLTHWPSALWCLSQLQVFKYYMQHRAARHGGPDLPAPPRAALPTAWLQLPRRRELDLSGQGYDWLPTVVTHLTALTCLDLTGNCVEVLPAGITALCGLAHLALGHSLWTGPAALMLGLWAAWLPFLG